MRRFMTRVGLDPDFYSTRSYIAAGAFLFIGLYWLGASIALGIAADYWKAFGYLVSFAVTVWLAWSFWRDANKVRGMSKDETLIAAALYESIKRHGADGPVRIISMPIDGPVDDEEEPETTSGRPSIQSGSLEELRRARKGTNASD